MSGAGRLFSEAARGRNAPARRALLEDNEQLRKERRTFQAPDGDSGHLAFRIPESDFYRHAFGEIVTIDAAGMAHIRRARYPDLVAADPAAQLAELRRLLRDHPEYKINPTEGRRMPVDGVIVK